MVLFFGTDSFYKYWGIYRHTTGKHYLGRYNSAFDDLYDYRFSTVGPAVTFAVGDSSDGPNLYFYDDSGIREGIIPEVSSDFFHAELEKYELIEPLPFQTPPEDPSDFLYTVEEVRQQLLQQGP